MEIFRLDHSNKLRKKFFSIVISIEYTLVLELISRLVINGMDEYHFKVNHYIKLMRIKSTILIRK